MLKKINNYLRRQSSRSAINKAIRRMAKIIDKAEPEADDNKVVVLFNASTRISGLSLNAAFEMLVGWSLRLQGLQVVNYVCKRGMTRCVLGTDKDDIYKAPPCQACVSQSAVIYYRSDTIWLDFYNSVELAKKLQETNLQTLRQFRFEGIPLGELCLPSMRWILRRHNLIDDEATRVLYRHYVLSAYKVAKQFDHLLNEAHPYSVLVFNGMQYPEATARWVAKRHGIPVYSHEVGLRPLSGFFTSGEATAYPVDISDDFQLSPQQNEQLDKYLSKRFKGDFSMAGINFWPEMQGLGESLKLKIQSFRQVVPIFTNVIFDTSQPHANVLFSDMFTWLDAVLEVVRAHPETLFVMRAHPDESRPGKASRESVADWAHERNIEALPNVVFIGPDYYFSSYEIIEHAKFVMIYNSTIGMEASIMGVPVLCAGKARFTQLETVFFPNSKKEYLITLERFLTEKDLRAPEAHRVNARRFLYYQLFRTSLPFDHFIEEDGIWSGYVRLKEFNWQDLLPEKSPTMRAISQGLLGKGDFLMPTDGE
ncbi:MAG: hypothetical protein ACK2TV_14350 [Anaerolineales bacterium]